MKYLAQIQAELKVPKGQYNSFGKYKYRSAEDILEAAKPINHKHGCVLTLSDDLVCIGERYYVKATATLTTPDHVITVSAFAREDEVKKGMDGSQITGTASSYARKYALNGLYNIDDSKDADTDEYRIQQTKSQTSKKWEKLHDDLLNLIIEKGTTAKAVCDAGNIPSLEALDENGLKEAIAYVSGLGGK